MPKRPPKDTKYAARLLSRADGEKPLFVGTADEIVHQMKLNNDDAEVRDLTDQEYMEYATTLFYKQGSAPPPWDPFTESWDATAFLIWVASLGAMDFEGDVVPDPAIIKMRQIREKLASGEIKTGKQLRDLVVAMGGTIKLARIDKETGQMEEQDIDDLVEVDDAQIQDITEQLRSMGTKLFHGRELPRDAFDSPGLSADDAEDEADVIAQALGIAEQKAAQPAGPKPPKPPLRRGNVNLN